MTESFGDLLIALLNDIKNAEEEKAEKNKSEKCIEMFDRDITFGIRERLCDENNCGFTGCPLFVKGRCIGNHKCKGIKVKIPERIIDAEAECREG